MSSILKTAMQDVLLQARNVTGIEYAAVFNNQVREELNGHTFDFPKPAILVEISNPNQGLQTLGRQSVTVSELTWRLSIVHEQLDSQDGFLDQNLTVFDFRDKVKVAFSFFKPKNCSLWQYSEESQDYAHNNIYVYSIAFKCSYVDTKGSPLDPDVVNTVINPPIALDVLAYITTPPPPHTRIAYGWKVCRFPNEGALLVVETPDPEQTTQLANGDIVPLQYALNDDGTITIPELASYPNISVLTPFLIGNQSYDTIEIDYSTGRITNTAGGFIIGNEISFNASLPLYTPE